MPANRRRIAKRLRPTIDRCEERQLLSTMTLLDLKRVPVVLSTSHQTSALSQLNAGTDLSSGKGMIHALSNEKMRGNNTAGYWVAGTSSFAIFAVQFDGSLTKSNAQKAFDYGKSYVTSREISLDTTSAAGKVRTTSSINVLIGFYDVKRKDYGWIAGTYAGTYSYTTPGYVAPWYRPWEKSYPPEIHTGYKLKYISSSMSSTSTVKGSYSINWSTQSGYKIKTKLDPVNSSGDVAPTFTKPS